MVTRGGQRHRAQNLYDGVPSCFVRCAVLIWRGLGVASRCRPSLSLCVARVLIRYPAEGEPGCPAQHSPFGPTECDPTAAGDHSNFAADKYKFAGTVTGMPRDVPTIQVSTGTSYALLLWELSLFVSCAGFAWGFRVFFSVALPSRMPRAFSTARIFLRTRS